jgi:hypothetical protein
MYYQVVIDPTPDNPREMFDHVGTMVCWHRRYKLGDQQPVLDPERFLRRLVWDSPAGNRAERLLDLFHRTEGTERGEKFERLWREAEHEALQRHYIILPVYLYDHSGLSMSTSPFSCPWDSGQVGYIYIRMDTARKEYPGLDGDDLRNRVINTLKAEVEEYSAYLAGEVYGWFIKDDVGETLDSCWGYYSYSHAEQEAKEVLQHWKAREVEHA